MEPKWALRCWRFENRIVGKGARMGPPTLTFSMRRCLEDAGVAKGAKLGPATPAFSLRWRLGDAGVGKEPKWTLDASVFIASEFGGRWCWKGARMGDAGVGKEPEWDPRRQRKQCQLLELDHDGRWR